MPLAISVETHSNVRASGNSPRVFGIAAVTAGSRLTGDGFRRSLALLVCSDYISAMADVSSSAFLKSQDLHQIAKIYGGLAFLGSLPGSPAEQAQLRRGDVVIAVNGMATPDLAAFLSARQLRDDGALVRYVRDGIELEAELQWGASH